MYILYIFKPGARRFDVRQFLRIKEQLELQVSMHVCVCVDVCVSYCVFAVNFAVKAL